MQSCLYHSIYSQIQWPVINTNRLRSSRTNSHPRLRSRVQCQSSSYLSPTVDGISESFLESDRCYGFHCTAGLGSREEARRRGGTGSGTHPLAANNGEDRVYPGSSVWVEFDRPEVCRRRCRNPSVPYCSQQAMCIRSAHWASGQGSSAGRNPRPKIEPPIRNGPIR